MPDAKISTLIGGKVHFIGNWNDDWKGRDEFMTLRSTWSQMTGIVNAHRDRELEKMKPENRRLGPEGPSEMQARLRRTGQQLKAVAAAEARTKEIAARLLDYERQMPKLRPDRGDVSAAFVRREIRERLAAMKPSEMVAALSNPDNEVLLAVLEMPSALSNVSAETRRRLEDEAFRRANSPEKLAELGAMHEALEVAHNSVKAAHAAVRDGLTSRDERELAVMAGEAAS